MAKEEELNMDLFSDDPVIDMTGDENIDYLFQDEEIELDDEDTNDETITNEDDQETDETDTVIGKDNEEETEEDKPADSDDADDSSSNPNLFNSLAELLAEKGLISSGDSELKVETEDDFISLFKKQIETSEYADLNDTQKEYLTKLREGIPHQKIEKDINDTQRLESITEDVIKDDSDLRQRIIYQDLINKGFSEDRAKKNLQRSIELELDLEDATEALESIKVFNQSRIDKENLTYQQEAEAIQEAENKRIENIKNRIKSTDEVIKNFKITDSVKEKVEKTMFDVVGENPDNNQKENSLMKYRRENPEDFDHKLYYLFTITNGFQNFDSLVKNTNSRVLKDLEKAVQSSTVIKDPGSPAYLQDPDSYSIDIAGHDIVVE